MTRYSVQRIVEDLETGHAHVRFDKTVVAQDELSAIHKVAGDLAGCLIGPCGATALIQSQGPHLEYWAAGPWSHEGKA